MFHLVMEDLIMQTGLVMVGPFLIERQDRLGLGKMIILENLAIKTMCTSGDTQVIQY